MSVSENISSAVPACIGISLFDLNPVIRNAAGANPYLTFHCTNQGTVLIDLAVDDKEFQSVEEEVKHEHFWALAYARLLRLCVMGVCFLVTDAKHNSGAQGWRKRGWRFQSI